MVTFWRGTAHTARFLTTRRTAAALGAVAALGLLTACGNDDKGTSAAPETLPGTAQPASGDTRPTDDSRAPVTSGAPSAPATQGGPRASSATTPSGDRATGTRCHTSELRAAVGPNNPGAGQENFPLVLTNRSQRTCTINGYPGAAFVDAAGKQVGSDPKRASNGPTKITLAPGASAWAGLTFSNPEVSGARTATPAAILITPPDEKASLKVAWKGGKVPVAGNSSSAFVTVFNPGTGA
ncbi:DUF4232 domain-containing protein [Streptomyces sp. RY43-2]|uniref:DUF4232 domain-containing protein n=1 Tax=Streptomyces macrolidinus TaxID=2952607 RepID=A0ABT0Z9T1_9ACTN|nr:DUF4232 domain-containing protein [Streptomyces macrolidinus]MCN9240503.1 DUF4232 domain-containing protein [Streptomyces macrolidinus]